MGKQSGCPLPCWGKAQTLNGADSIGAVNNLDSVTDPLFPSSANYINPVPALQFGETAIDLTAAGVFPPGTCKAFGSAFVKSRASASFGAEVKDFIAPINVSISNCGTITIHKVTVNGDSTFGYTTTGGLTPATFSLSNGGTQTYGPDTVLPGSYTVSESSVPAGWTLTNLVCTSSGTGTSASTSLSTATASITMAAQGVVDCTYTNQTSLTPTITTALTANPIPVGGSTSDTATLHNASANAGGTVDYRYYSSLAACQADASAFPGTAPSGGTDVGSVNVTGGSVSGSASVPFPNAGTFYWAAFYSGDPNNTAAVSDCTTELLVVSQATPTMSTAPNLIPNDDATISAASSNAGGTITFNLFSPSDATCSSTPAFTQKVNVSGNGTYSTTNTAFVASATGTWRWQVIYSGDASNVGTTSDCGVENFTITSG